LTLARVRELSSHIALPPGMDLLEKLIEIGSFDVQKMTLFESQLYPSGAIYTSLCELPLKLKEGVRS